MKLLFLSVRREHLLLAMLAPAGAAALAPLEVRAAQWSSATQPQSSAVTPQQFLRPGERLSVDSGPAIRRALATGLPVRFPAGDYVVRPDPAATPRHAERGYSILIRDNAQLAFERGARIVQAPGGRSWLRTVSFQDADNVRVKGELWVDGNVSGMSPVNNEHMHGVFLYNTTNSTIDAIRSENARGDNVYIGGDPNSAGSRNVSIGSIRASTAGRKNLVLAAVRDVRIGRAELDNRQGGAKLFGGEPTRTDGHSLDVEPNKFTGAVANSAWIGAVETYGSGNDFSVGTNARQADSYRVEIGSLRSHITPRPGVAPWIQNAITLAIGNLQITGATGDTPSEIRYAARLYVDRLTLVGSNPGMPLLWVAPARGQAPDVRIGIEDVRNPAGEGIRRGGKRPRLSR